MCKLLKERLLTLQHVPVRFAKKCARTRRAGAGDREQAGQHARTDYWHGTTADMQLSGTHKGGDSKKPRRQRRDTNETESDRTKPPLTRDGRAKPGSKPTVERGSQTNEAGTCEREACGSQSRRAAHKRAAAWAAPHSKAHTCPAHPNAQEHRRI
jgi:hypothetical protein